ncbi:GntR family transcriptional regulator [Paenarthrobacter sp. NPDC089316]|uniref:GntR family transcriptional regulator n=1 Tax=unclassified Paenarthrobacter TaxID=2634190 RepID=UPI0034439A0F
MDRKFEWQEQRTTTPDGVYRVLRTAILDGTVAPGEQLRETHIATDLGISRSPLREALTKLEEEGLVVKVPFRGSFVVEVSARDIAEIASIRMLVEPYAAELAAPTLRDAESLRLKQTLEELHHATDTSDIPASIDAHLRFHRLFYEYSGNAALRNLWNGWENKLRLYFAADHPTYTDLHQIAVEHEKLAELALDGDIEGYRQEMLSQFHNALGSQTPDPT